MNNKKIGLLFIVLGLVAIAAVIYFLLTDSFAPPVDITQTTGKPGQLSTGGGIGGGAQPGGGTAEIDLTELSVTDKEASDASIAKQASVFTERLGSFSSQSGEENVKDLSLLMTDELKSWALTYVKQSSEQGKGKSGFYGVTTRSLSSSVLSVDEGAGKAKVLVRTQRTETTADQKDAKVSNADMEVSLVKEEGRWLVDRAEWK